MRASSGEVATRRLAADAACVPAATGVDQHVLRQVDVDQRPRQLLEPPDAGGEVLQCGDSQGSARVAAVLGQVLQLGDLALAFDPGRVIGWKGLDQPSDAVADLEGEVGGGGPGQGADVLGRDLVAGSEQLWALGLAHGSPPIFVSAARLSNSACWFTSMAPSSPITHTWL